VLGRTAQPRQRFVGARDDRRGGVVASRLHSDDEVDVVQDEAAQLVEVMLDLANSVAISAEDVG